MERRVVLLRQRFRRLLEQKPAIVVEMTGVLLLPALWGTLPLPRSIVPVLLLAWLSLWLRGRTWRELGLRRPHSWKAALLWGAGAGVLIASVGKVIVPVLLQRFGEGYEPGGLHRLKGNLPLFLMLLSGTWLLAALAEEMVFRGYLLNRLMDLLGQDHLASGVSLGLSALAFSTAHGIYDPWYLAATFLQGLLLGGLYLLGRRNLWYPVIAHGTGITITITLAYLGIV